MAKTGRKRKAMAARHPGGAVVQPIILPDYGTPEQYARRFAAFGARCRQRDDGRELSDPLDLLERKLTTEQYTAGRKAVAVGNRATAAISPPRLVSGMLADYVEGSKMPAPMDAEQVEQAKKEFELLRRCVLREVRRETGDPAMARKAWRSLQAIMRREQPRSLDALRLALNVVAVEYGYANAVSIYR